MSKEQKSGEDLIEKVEQEVAETTQETKEETPAFDPKAFANGEETKVETPAEEAEETNEPKEQEVPEEEGDDFSWDKVELEKEPEQEQEEDEDWGYTADVYTGSWQEAPNADLQLDSFFHLKPKHL